MTIDRPNFLVIQADQLAAAALGAYGNPVVRSPHLDNLAADSVIFDRAYCNSPLCAPSRASMLTGRLPSEVGVYDNGSDFPASVPTLAHHLRSVGYRTTLIGRMHFIGPDQLHGFEERLTTDVYPAGLDMVPDWRLGQGKRLSWYHDSVSVFTADPSRATVQQDFDDEVLFRTLRHLNDVARSDESRPFLIVSSFIHPHDPYEPPARFWELYESIDIDDPALPPVSLDDLDPHSRRLQEMSGFDVDVPTPEQIRHARRAYYACVSYVDELIGRIVERLRLLDLEDNTVIVVTSDHGDLLGERGMWFKMSPFEQSTRVPLFFHSPTRFAARRVADVVSLVDLLPTLTDLGGAPAPDGVGRSLRPYLEGGAVAEERDTFIEYLAEGVRDPHLSVVRGDYKLTRCADDPLLLFNVALDPLEQNNLATDPEYAPIVQSLTDALDARYDEQALGRQIHQSQAQRRLVAEALTKGHGTEWDHEPPATRGYVRGDFWSALNRGRLPG